MLLASAGRRGRGSFVGGGGGGGTGINVSHDFENGAAGPYSTTAGVTFPNDPTPRAAGKVCAINYAFTAGGGGGSQDRALSLTSQTLSAGTSQFFGADLYLNTYDNNRKLFRVDSNTGPGNTWIVVNEWTGSLKIEGYRAGSNIIWNGNLLSGASTTEAWHHLELEIKPNSAVGVSDGIVRLWWDNVLKFEDTALQLYAADSNYDMWRVGEQASADASVTVNETRYWDNVEFSTAGRVT